MIAANNISLCRGRSALAILASAIIMLGSSLTAQADISKIDLRVGGEAVQVPFSQGQTDYDITVPHSGVVSFSAIPDSPADIVSVDLNGTAYTDHSIARIYKGSSVLTYTVAAPSAEPKTYTLRINAERNPLSTDIRSLSIYQIMVASFLHGEGGAPGYTDMWSSPEQRKDGNLRGVIEALPYIKDMGMNAIWMTPIFDSSDNPNGELIQATGYFPTDYFNIDPHFGTLEEFKELLDVAHSLDLYVFLDGPFGQTGGVPQTSPEGHTLEISATSITVDNGETSWPPTNLYPGSLEFIKEVVRYWTNIGIDGWRLDSAVEMNQGGHNYWEEIRAEQLKACQKRIEAGEKWGTLGLMLAEEWGEPSQLLSVRPGGLNCIMDTWWRWSMDSLIANWSISTFKNLFVSPDKRRYYSGVYPASFLSNHDMPRIFDRIGQDRGKLRMLHAAIVCNSQPIINYYGDEFGDCSGALTHPGYTDNCGRTSGHLTPNNEEEAALQSLVKQYYHIRADHPAMWRGEVSCIDLTDGFVSTKTDPETGETIHIAFPFGNCSYTLPAPCIDLLTGLPVSGEVTLKANTPRFFLEQ